MLSFKRTLFTTGFVAILQGLCSEAKTCNVLDYGAKADNKTDIGPALWKAFEDCKRSSTGRPQDTIVLVPKGDFSIATNVVFRSGSGITFTFNGNLNLIFSRTLTGNMLLFVRLNDIIINGAGRFNGNGRAYRPNGQLHRDPPRPRLVRIENCVNVDYSSFSLYDSPMYHLTVFLGTNVRVHNLEIHAPDIGTTDGINVAGTNIRVSDVVVEGGDECVSVKSPANGIHVENVKCIHTDGCSLGSMGPSAKGYSIKNVMFRNVSVSDASNAIIIKSYPNAEGVISNLTCTDFRLTNVAYGIKLDYSWGQTLKSKSRTRSKRGAAGQSWSDLKFINFSGTAAKYNVLLNCPPQGCKHVIMERINILVAKHPALISKVCGSVDALSRKYMGSLRAC